MLIKLVRVRAGHVDCHLSIVLPLVSPLPNVSWSGTDCLVRGHQFCCCCCCNSPILKPQDDTPPPPVTPAAVSSSASSSSSEEDEEEEEEEELSGSNSAHSVSSSPVPPPLPPPPPASIHLPQRPPTPSSIDNEEEEEEEEEEEDEKGEDPLATPPGSQGSSSSAGGSGGGMAGFRLTINKALLPSSTVQHLGEVSSAEKGWGGCGYGVVYFMEMQGFVGGDPGIFIYFLFILVCPHCPVHMCRIMCDLCWYVLRVV